MAVLPCLARTRLLGTASLRRICPPLASYCILRKTVSSVSKPVGDRSVPVAGDDGYDLVYTFPYVRVAAAINKLKLYQTCVSGCAVPLSFALQIAGVIPLEAVSPVVAISLTSAVALHAAGFVCNGLVGHVWVSRGAEQPQVRMSSVGFWGGRSELRLPASDLLPLAELPDSPTALYVSLRRYSAPASLKLCLRYGRVANAPAFRRVFGHAPF